MTISATEDGMWKGTLVITLHKVLLGVETDDGVGTASGL